MLSVKIDFSKNSRSLHAKTRRAHRRLLSTARRETKRAGERFVRGSIKQLKATTGIRYSQREIRNRYIKTFVGGGRSLSEVSFTARYRRKGVALIGFVRGKIKPTYGPLRSRRSPYVSIYKGARTRVNRGFIIRRKSTSGDGVHVLLRRTPRGVRPTSAPSIISLLEKRGFDFRRAAEREGRRLRIAVRRRLGWITEGLSR